MDKKRFRKKCIERLKELRRGAYRKRDRMVVNRLAQLVRQEKAHTVMIYIPMDIEVDVRGLIRVLRRQRREILVPFMEGESFGLVKYKMPLSKKRFGIMEPKNSNFCRRKEIDLAIVPMVGTDPTMRRVGFGKGMFDRFFEKEKKNIKKTAFVSRGLCKAEDIVTDDHDVGADIIITPETMLRRKMVRRWRHR